MLFNERFYSDGRRAIMTAKMSISNNIISTFSSLLETVEKSAFFQKSLSENPDIKCRETVDAETVNTEASKEFTKCVRDKIEALCEEHDLHVKVSDVALSNNARSELGWRPTGSPQEDLALYKRAVLLKQEKRLQEIRDVLNSKVAAEKERVNKARNTFDALVESVERH
ncbi:hypothetical protein QR680_013322 [Steinernema hermaphroditum]|uniref:Uncharacterized protein n=1 Tax=Steinernema hermaphroditum TaxID=289476 RepID=A0AA39M1D0_9BILA|nr:hypothetical protein QR680_013322 [Steinernema hermaphroditum]